MQIQDLKPELESSLDCLSLAWFPRCLDRERGGFFCEYDQSWRAFGHQPKLLEFQARQTMFASELSLWYPQESLFAESAEWGFECLRAQMWDPEYGGWFHCLSRDGIPMEGRTKHTHGMAYAIQACLSFYRASGQEAALLLAKMAFRWLEDHAHDPLHGGYFGFLSQDGKPILAPVDNWTHPLDSIRTPLGFKDLNVHSDYLETLICLAQEWEDPLVLERLEEVLGILTKKAQAPNGALHFFLSADWQPIPHTVVVGNAFQSICRLVWAAKLLDHPQYLENAKQLWTWAQRCAREPQLPGFAACTVGEAPFFSSGSDLRVRYRSWWVQAEALRAMLVLAETEGGGQWEALFREHWTFFNQHFIDRKYGGTRSGSSCHLRFPWQRFAERWLKPDLYTHKANAWKDGSHDGRAVLHALRVASGESGLKVLPTMRG